MDSIIEDINGSTENIISPQDVNIENIGSVNQLNDGTSSSDGVGYIRFLALVFMCILGFGSYFCYDNPGALQDNFIKDMGLSTTQFTLLYSWYSWPNVVLCFIGGFLIDRVFGIKFGTILYAGIVVLGQIIFAYGAYTNSFLITILGRFIFGIGGESLAVAQNNYAVVWFMGKELNTVFGLQLSFARVGSTVNIVVMEPLYDWVANYFSGYQCLGVSLFIATSTCIMSLFCAIFLGMLHNKPKETLTVEKNNETVRITDVKDFNITFWLITVICIAYYVAIFPLIALGKVFFERKFGLDSVHAGYANSLLYLTSAVLSPISGFIIDKCGRNVCWVFISILVTIIGHSMLAFTFINPFISMSIIGISYSMLAAALWPLVAYIIPHYQLGTAYGVAQAVQNLGLAVITMYAGMIVDNGGYLMLELFFLSWLCLALLVSILIWIYDATHTGILNMTPAQREEFERNKLVAQEREKLLASGSMSDITPQDLLQPQSDFHIRNRYLSRIGASGDAE
uniref:Lysosomal dipeptide transporter MFSD1 n=2 Tax=Clastoptera arizonana TaxID=38151 RepID=A0A1B6D2G0_9HEMI